MIIGAKGGKMAYTQVIKFTPKPYEGGLCLKFVRECFGVPEFAPTAMDAWNKTHQITGAPPKGVDVPVYFSLGNNPAGHVAVSLADGRVASSSLPGKHTVPYYHASIDALIKFYGQGIKYLGWSDKLGGVQIVKEGKVITNMETPRTCYTPKDNKVHFFNKKEVNGTKQTLISPDGTRAAYPNEVVNLEVLEQPRWMILPERKNEKCYVAAKAKQSKLVLIYDGKGYTQYKNV
jgi:hypothetical protein